MVVGFHLLHQIRRFSLLAWRSRTGKKQWGWRSSASCRSHRRRWWPNWSTPPSSSSCIFQDSNIDGLGAMEGKEQSRLAVLRRARRGGVTTPLLSRAATAAVCGLQRRSGRSDDSAPPGAGRDDHGGGREEPL